MSRRHLLYLFTLFALFIIGCDKKESPITLPSPGLAVPGTVEMGENYDTEIYYDFENNKIVKTSVLGAWDLSFESAALGTHVFINGGVNVVVINTHKQSFSAVTDIPAGTTAASWKSDASSGDPDSTGIGEWTDAYGNSKGEVYVIQLGNGDIKKLRLISVSSSKYEFEFGDINAAVGIAVQLPKNHDCNFTYFSFANGVIQQEPPKTDWDVLFTRYRTVLYDRGKPLPYNVCGALLNPGSTSAAVDSVTGFDQYNISNALAAYLSTERDAIGYHWKDYSLSTGRYTVNSAKVYPLRTRNGLMVKLHFLDFYSKTGVKGTPTFESEILR